VTLYYEETEVIAWETFTGNNRSNAEIIKVAGNNRINDVTPINFSGYTINNTSATIGSFNSDVTFTASFTNGFSGFGVGIYNVNPTVVTHSTVNTNPLCTGSSDGSIVVTASGGTLPYQYSIDGGTTWQSSDTFSGLAAGSYNVIVEDAANNQSNFSVVTLVDPPLLTYTATSTDPLCNGSSDGTITMTGNGGTGSLQYSVDAGISFQSSGTFTGLSASTYNIIVEDINGCQTAGSITLNDPIAISYSATSTNENCGSGDGSLTLNASGGSGSFQYSIDGGTNFQSSGSFTGLTAGNYNVVIEDTFGCQTSGIETVGSSGGAVISNITSVHPTCNGYNDGSISITASGNALPLTYSIDGGTTFQSSGSFSGLAGNTYNIVVLDANSCQITASVTLTDPPAITYTTTSVHPYCNGDLNGSISLIASGGTGSLQYSIDGGTTFQSSGAFINLSAGTYSIVIEDANGCQSTGSVTLNDPPALSYTSSVINETCGNANGSITLTGTGGNGSLQYSIDGGVNFQSSGTFTGLTGFTYNIIIQDANGCQATGSETVNSEDSPVITSINTTDPLCYGGNGSIVIITSGGTGMLQYSIDGGNNFGASASFNTPSGNYSIVVEDANGCQVVGNTVLNDPQIISFTTTSTGENCGAMDATITINGSGGTGSLIYSINGGTNFQTTGSFTGLSSGSYNIVVQDDNGCQVTGTEIISSIGGSTISNIASTDPSCYGDNDGIISITASGINTPLQYSVDGGTTFQTSGTFSSISSGNYIIVVEDAIGCQTFDSIVVNDPPALTYISSSIDENCGAGDGALSFMPSGGSGSY